MYRASKISGSNLMFDLRSDTVTKPTAEMLKAMISSDCGDDVFQSDSTVNLLQNRVADLTGKDAALYCVSGTMSNQVSLEN